MSETINNSLKEHAINVEDWCYHKHIKFLHEWAERFIHEFDLNIETPAIQIEKVHFNVNGTYKPRRNGFGLLYEITLNARYIERPLPELLFTLFHEILHEWQHFHGNPSNNNYHNKEFQDKAFSYGLLISQWGNPLGVIPGLFTKLLERHGIDSSILSVSEEIFTKPKGNSKMKKWSCGCTNVRAAVDLNARCLKCGSLFKKKER